MVSRSHAFAYAAVASFVLLAKAQQSSGTPPSSWPQVYPGMPNGNYSPEWQDYFQVTDNLPNVTWPLARNWAGNIPVQREDHPNDTLFFWAFESQEGSFTSTSTDAPWGIWLNGGPGSSSLVGLLFENGPIHVQNNYSLFENQYAWNTIADYVWIDQPVGVGFGTADSTGYIVDEDQMATDFFGFLENLVKVFPGLAKRPLHLTGESYAGMYIPYITKAYFEMENPPVTLAKIAIGDGSIASGETFELLPVVSALETYPQIIGYDTTVFQYFREQEALCGYNLTLEYPQNGHFPTLTYTSGADPNTSGMSASGRYRARQGQFSKKLFLAKMEQKYNTRLAKRSTSLSKRERLRARDLAVQNGTIDTWYGCDVYDEMLDYAINFTFPWSLSKDSGGMFDVYNIPDALNPEAPMDGSSINYPFGNDYSNGDPSIESVDPLPMAFLTELATNATAQNISVVIFSGNDDSLIPHLGSQSFTRKPSTPWYNDDGQFAGIVHQERNWTYVLVEHAGHLVGYTNPQSGFVFVREFVFGSNQTGLVANNSSGAVTVMGGEVSSLANEIMTGQAAIYYGSATTESTYYFPTATVEAWNAYIATATTQPVIVSPRQIGSSASWPVAQICRTIALGSVIMVFTLFAL
ncbi:Alpha/Beta hydrolase protein [Suillus paluster]|uniref:Alpha/Beta hydrolase protein n=1 Tax=Suillus paluster TaxID=48578 RepID=UPI001B866F11|nr:Alpha/Beta hydrolase protein [Suillus paluster]KAG1721432.1 Alpha/Beta hydrolase protein [Suillus paluster]